jgi:hypothetical protein
MSDIQNKTHSHTFPSRTWVCIWNVGTKGFACALPPDRKAAALSFWRTLTRKKKWLFASIRFSQQASSCLILNILGAMLRSWHAVLWRQHYWTLCTESNTCRLVLIFVAISIPITWFLSPHISCNFFFDVTANTRLLSALMPCTGVLVSP